MNIDRHNYEEFFILYLDNELSSSDRLQVEDFANANPDLKAELDLLLQSKLIPDTDIIFDGKDTLLKKEDETIINAETASMLLYIDKELSAEKKSSFEQWIVQNPAAQTELNLLQQAKLQPEHIVFPYKESLYRQEERRVVPIRWWRMAAAAVLLLGMSTAAFMFNEKRQNRNIAEQTTQKEKTLAEVKTKFADTPNPAGLDQVPVAEEFPASNVTVSKEQDSFSDPDAPVLPHKINGEVTDVVKAPDRAGYNPGTIQDNTVRTSVEQTDHVVNLRPALSASLNESSYVDDINVQGDPSLTINKQINPLPGVTQEEDQSLDIMNEPGKKNRLRGFFRKITRTFEKTTNIKATDGEDRLLVGGLAIKF